MYAIRHVAANPLPRCRVLSPGPETARHPRLDQTRGRGGWRCSCFRGRVIEVAMAFRLLAGRLAVFQVTAVIPPVVEHANDKNA